MVEWQLLVVTIQDFTGLGQQGSEWRFTFASGPAGHYLETLEMLPSEGAYTPRRSRKHWSDWVDLVNEIGAQGWRYLRAEPLSRQPPITSLYFERSIER